jgi:hypothetical protein
MNFTIWLQLAGGEHRSEEKKSRAFLDHPTTQSPDPATWALRGARKVNERKRLLTTVTIGQ